ncbi:MAG: hypothetical protein CSYNP_02831 [Syntrophus sp. SKADARSKE-3]|nr:hypothetical protein [Syntrophus sp. SKADARSKE-3]
MKEEPDDQKIVIGEGARIATEWSGILQYEFPDILSYPDSDRNGPFWCIGMPRTGKTRILENIAEQDIRSRYSTVVIDPKGDLGLFAKIVQVANETGRQDELQVITTISDIINMAHNDQFIERLETGKRIIMVVHRGPRYPKEFFTVGMAIILMIQSYVGKAFSAGKKVTPPLSLFIDEAHTMLYNGIDRLFSKAGSAGVMVHVFSQSVSQMNTLIGQDNARSILSNIKTKIFMKMQDTETVEDIDGITPEDVMGLNAREFFMTRESGVYKGRTLDVSPLSSTQKI